MGMAVLWTVPNRNLLGTRAVCPQTEDGIHPIPRIIAVSAPMVPYRLTRFPEDPPFPATGSFEQDADSNPRMGIFMDMRLGLDYLNVFGWHQ